MSYCRKERPSLFAIVIAILLVMSMLLAACGGTTPAEPATGNEETDPGASEVTESESEAEESGEPEESEEVSEESSGSEGGTIRLGAVWPLTGPNASFGSWLTDASAMAIEEINAEGGVNGKQLELIIEDSRGQAQEGSAAFTKLATVDQVPVIFEIISGVVLATMPLAEQHQVILMDTASTSPQVREGGDYVFSLRPKADLVAPAAASFAYNEMGARTAAFMATNIEFGRNWTEAGIAVWEELGGEVVAEEYHEQDQTDFRTQITKVRDANPDVVFMPGSFQPMSFIVSQAAEVGWYPPIIGTNFANEDWLDIVGDAAQGAMYFEAGYDPTDTSEIATHYNTTFQERTGELPEYAGATVYDAVRIVAEAMEICQCEDTEGIREALFEIEGFPGATGPSTFDEDGIVIKPVRAFQYQDGTWVRLGQFDGENWNVTAEVLNRPEELP